MIINFRNFALKIVSCSGVSEPLDEEEVQEAWKSRSFVLSLEKDLRVNSKSGIYMTTRGKKDFSFSCNKGFTTERRILRNTQYFITFFEFAGRNVFNLSPVKTEPLLSSI